MILKLFFSWNLYQKLIFFFLRSLVFNKSEIYEYPEFEMCFFKLEILKFSPTNKTKLDMFFFDKLFL